MPTYHLGTVPCNFAKGYKTVLFIDACLFLAFAVRQVFDSAGTISERQEFRFQEKSTMDRERVVIFDCWLIGAAIMG